MSFAAFEVHLYPAPNSPVCSAENSETLNALVSEVQSNWPGFRPDEIEIARLFQPLQANQTLLMYETSEGLIQLGIRLELPSALAVFSLDFAYCNPRSVYEPFCNIVEGLMRRYRLYCHVVSDLAPDQIGVSDEIDQAEDVRSVLIPSMDYNRKLWQLDAQTKEEAILRPGEAVARFITPQYISG